MALRFFIKIFGLWILWKIRPEFHTRKALVQNSKRAFSRQTPQALLSKPHIYQKYFSKNITDEKANGVLRKSGRDAPRRRSLPKGCSPVRICPVNFSFFVENSRKKRRAHLCIPSECRIMDKPRDICCFEGFFKTFSKWRCDGVQTRTFGSALLTPRLWRANQGWGFS